MLITWIPIQEKLRVNFRKTKRKAGYVGDEFGQRKNDYGNVGVFHAWCLAPKVECWVSPNN